MSLIPFKCPTMRSREFYPYKIPYSAQFDRTATEYLTWNPAVEGDRQKYTLNIWFKSGDPGTTYIGLFDQYNGNFGCNIRHDLGGFLALYGNGGALHLQTDMVFDDFTKWYNLIVAVDTTQATASDRCKIFVDGVRITNFRTASYPSKNTSMYWNRASRQHNIGIYGAGGGWDGWIVAQHVDGQSLGPESFGEFKQGVWIPKEYVGSYGQNGFWLDFSDAANMGKDVSGNGNDFSIANGTPTQSLDTPTNNLS